MRRVVRVPFIAPDGSHQVALTHAGIPLRPLINPLSPPPDVVSCNSSANISSVSDDDPEQQSLHSREPTSRTEEDIAIISQDIFSLAKMLLTHIGERSMNQSQRSKRRPNSRLLGVESLGDLISKYTDSRNLLDDISERLNDTMEEQAYLILRHAEHRVALLLRKLLVVSGEFEHLLQRVGTGETFCPLSDDAGVDYLHRLMTACEMHCLDSSTTSKGIGDLWVLYSVLTSYFPGGLTPSLNYAIDEFVVWICQNLSVRVYEYKLADSDVAAVIKDTVRKW